MLGEGEMKPIKDRSALNRVNGLALQLGKYIIDTYLQHVNKTGELDMSLTVKVYKQNGEIRFDVNPTQK